MYARMHVCEHIYIYTYVNQASRQITREFHPNLRTFLRKFFTEQLETTLSLKLLPVCVKGGRWKGEFFLLELPHDSVFDRQVPQGGIIEQ